MKVTVKVPTEEDLLPVLDEVRQADKDEWEAGTGYRFEDAALSAVRWDGDLKGCLVDEHGRGLVFWGVDGKGESGWCWMFATETAQRHAIELHRHLLGEFLKVSSRWPHLYAISDVRNRTHHRWLTWLGFHHSMDLSFGNGHRFRTFEYRRPEPCA